MSLLTHVMNQSLDNLKKKSSLTLVDNVGDISHLYVIGIKIK